MPFVKQQQFDVQYKTKCSYTSHVCVCKSFTVHTSYPINRGLVAVGKHFFAGWDGFTGLLPTCITLSALQVIPSPIGKAISWKLSGFILNSDHCVF